MWPFQQETFPAPPGRSARFRGARLANGSVPPDGHGRVQNDPRLVPAFELGRVCGGESRARRIAEPRLDGTAAGRESPATPAKSPTASSRSRPGWPAPFRSRHSCAVAGVARPPSTNSFARAWKLPRASSSTLPFGAVLLAPHGNCSPELVSRIVTPFLVSAHLQATGQPVEVRRFQGHPRRHRHGQLPGREARAIRWPRAARPAERPPCRSQRPAGTRCAPAVPAAAPLRARARQPRRRWPSRSLSEQP